MKWKNEMEENWKMIQKCKWMRISGMESIEGNDKLINSVLEAKNF